MSLLSLNLFPEAFFFKVTLMKSHFWGYKIEVRLSL
jgi:hypothetical protein